MLKKQKLVITTRSMDREHPVRDSDSAGVSLQILLSVPLSLGRTEKRLAHGIMAGPSKGVQVLLHKGLCKMTS